MTVRLDSITSKPKLSLTAIFDAIFQRALTTRTLPLKYRNYIQQSTKSFSHKAFSTR